MQTLTRPAAGRRTRIPLAGQSEIAFSFSPADAVFRRKAEALFLFFPGNASVEIPDFFPAGNIPRLAITLPDGSRMDAAELLALFAPGIALQSAEGLSGYARGAAEAPGLGDLSSLAGNEEPYLAFTAAAATADTARQNLLPVYQEVEFRDGEIVFGPSIYGSFLPLGGEEGLHIHLDNSEGEMLDMDSLVARLPGLFPDHAPIRAVAVTGGSSNRILLNEAALSHRLETTPLEGFGTTQFDRYQYRPASNGVLTLFLQTVLHLVR